MSQCLFTDTFLLTLTPVIRMGLRREETSEDDTKACVWGLKPGLSSVSVSSYTESILSSPCEKLICLNIGVRLVQSAVVCSKYIPSVVTIWVFFLSCNSITAESINAAYALN